MYNNRRQLSTKLSNDKERTKERQRSEGHNHHRGEEKTAVPHQYTTSPLIDVVFNDGFCSKFPTTGHLPPLKPFRRVIRKGVF